MIDNLNNKHKIKPEEKRTEKTEYSNKKANFLSEITI
jgi:hypothetical protein